MTYKDKIIPAAISLAIAASGWAWSLYNDHEIRISAQERSTAVIEEKKADRSELAQVQIQIAQQTVILENLSKTQEVQSQLMEKQYELMKAVASGNLVK